MDSSSIELPGSEIERVEVDGSQVSVHFSCAYIIKTLSGSVERTRWRQVGTLIFGEAEVEGELPTTPCICDGGDVGQSVYTYRDMLPIPFEGRGRAYCDLRVRESDRHLKVMGETVRLELQDRPYYIEHIRPE